jgi:hypothetical protein
MVILGVGVTAGDFTYLWFREGAGGDELVNSGPSGFLRLDQLQAGDEGTYFVVVIDREGLSVRSSAVSVTVLSDAE